MDFMALQDHYGGAANKTLRIKEAEVLRKTLIYRNERAMSFEKFITNMNIMFVAYSENGETLTEDQKIRLLFEKIAHPNLETIKSSLQVAENLDQVGAVNYEFIVNSVSAEVASLPDYVSNNRNASGVDTHGGEESPANGVIGSNGRIFTGFYKNFNSLTAKKKQSIFDERQRMGITPKKSRRGSRVSAVSPKVIKDKNKQVESLQRKIASLKIKVAAKEDAGKKRPSIPDADDESVQDNAGTQFGGRKSKKDKKQKKEKD
jgi:hypothetical protein